VRRELLKQADVHTLLRLPTGIFYAQGVKANVLFFDRKPASEKPWTEKLWIYDLRTNQHFTLKEKTLGRAVWTSLSNVSTRRTATNASTASGSKASATTTYSNGTK
jgi:N-6 DNA Methylase